MASTSFTITPAAIEQDTSEQLVIAAPRSSILMPILAATFCFVAGLVLVSFGSVGVLAALLPLTFTIIFLTRYSYGGRLVFDFRARQVIFSTNFLIHTPRRIQFHQAFADGLQADIQLVGSLFKRKMAVLEMANGLPINLALEINEAETLIMRVNRLRRYAMEQNYASQQGVINNQWVIGPAAAVAASPAVTVQPADAVALPADGQPTAQPAAEEAAAKEATAEEFAQRQQAHQRAALRATLAIQLQNRIQSWVVWLVIMAVMQFAFDNWRFSPYAVIYVLLALVSLIFKESVMLAVYAMVIGWAGISNLFLYPDIFFKGLALLQFYWCYLLMQEFRRYIKLERIAAEPDSPAPVSRAAGWFPWISMSLGGLSLLIFLGGIMAGSTTQFLIGYFIAILGLAVGIGAWIARFPNRFASVIGTLASIMTLLAYLVLNLMG